MQLPPWTRSANQPATYPRVFLDLAGERGVDREAVLRHAGVPRARIDDPAGRLSLVETWRIHEAISARIDDPTFGYEVGCRFPLTAHGSLGIALLCAPSLREALAILERYWHLRGRGVTLRASLRDEVLLELSLEVPTPDWLRDQLFSSMLATVYRGLCFLSPDAAADTELWVPGDEPRGFAVFRDRLPHVRFGMPLAGARSGAALRWLDRPLATANPEGLAHALASCERESTLCGGSPDRLVSRVRAALHLGARGYATAAAVAKALHLTPRTLRRQLQEHATSYQALLQEARRRDACRLLEKPELSVREIGAVLGYDEPANFTRAFRAWTGTSPSEWRKAHGG